MQIQKKQLQTIIMIVIVVITMTGFGFWAKQKIAKKNVVQNQNRVEAADIDLAPRPIEELFASKFSGIKKNETNLDPLKCNSRRILDEQEKEKKTYIERSEKLGEFRLEENCWRSYENDEYKFNFQDTNDSIGFLLLHNAKFILTDRITKKSVALEKSEKTFESIDSFIKYLKNQYDNRVYSVRHYKNINDEDIYVFFYSHYEWNQKTSDFFSLLVELNNEIYVLNDDLLNPLVMDALSTIKAK